MVESLLAAGARLDAIDDEGMTALQVAAQCENRPAVSFLLRRSHEALAQRRRHLLGLASPPPAGLAPSRNHS